MRSDRDKARFLEVLKEMPIVSVACKRVGINKATIYRWRNSDSAFSDNLNNALEEGRDSIADLAESRLFSHVSRGEPWAIRYALEALSKRYYRPRPVQRVDPERFVAKIEYVVVPDDPDLKEKVEKIREIT